MVELQHTQPEPTVLAAYKGIYPSETNFDAKTFIDVKPAIRAALNKDQGGLCVYCERKLSATRGQIDHIKPKSGPNAQPALTFTYSNYAHSCITEGRQSTCGQQKKHGVLPIEPTLGCNTQWVLSTSDGKLEPKLGLTRKQQAPVRLTCDMLGLNTNAVLVAERLEWAQKYIEVLKLAAAQGNPALANQFLQIAPFRHILKTI
ncbi:TIGR02646 family protein [Chitinibacter sp. SCUT-21]|uniref:retron system putative HNH endonuclease n=1 Tax=Chitinibacter sp. SCUT-21 TaxID=2970891 RepID=UPI0035A7121C